MKKQLKWDGIRHSWQFSDKYEVHMFKCVFMTYTLHVHDVFDEMHLMARVSRGRSLFKFSVTSLVFLLFIISQDFTKFWAEAWVLALKKWLRIRGPWHKTPWERLLSLGGLVLGVTGGLQSLGGLIMGETRGLVQLKSKLTLGLGTWSGWWAPRGLVAPEKVSLVLVCRFHFLNFT